MVDNKPQNKGGSAYACMSEAYFVDINVTFLFKVIIMQGSALR